MIRVFIFGAISVAMVTMLSVSWAATNLNSSRSNIYRLVYPADLISQTQATTLLAELEKLGPSGEAKLKRWLPANFKRQGIQAARIKKISILIGRQMACAECEKCKGKCGKGQSGLCSCYEPITTAAQVRRVDKASPILILILTDPADEVKALALPDEATAADKPNR